MFILTRMVAFIAANHALPNHHIRTPYSVLWRPTVRWYASNLKTIATSIWLTTESNCITIELSVTLFAAISNTNWAQIAGYVQPATFMLESTRIATSIQPIAWLSIVISQRHLRLFLEANGAFCLPYSKGNLTVIYDVNCYRHWNPSSTNFQAYQETVCSRL